MTANSLCSMFWSFYCKHLILIYVVGRIYFPQAQWLQPSSLSRADLQDACKRCWWPQGYENAVSAYPKGAEMSLAAQKMFSDDLLLRGWIPSV